MAAFGQKRPFGDAPNSINMSDKNILLNITKSAGLTIGLLLAINSGSHAATMGRDEVLLTFNQYMNLNDDFVSSVGPGKGKVSGKPYDELRDEVEAFGDNQFEEALSSAIVLACQNADEDLVSQIIHVIFRTVNSASELPDLALGHIFVCQPQSVQGAFRKLDKLAQLNIYERLSNGVLGAIEDDKVPSAKAKRLRSLLDKLAPTDHSDKW